MITMRKFPLGRIGNNLFQIAFIKSMAIRYRTEWMLPQWNHVDKFCMKWNPYNGYEAKDSYMEPSSGFEYGFNLPSDDVNIYGYFQSEEYFKDYWDEFKDEFRWNEEFANSIKERNSFIPGDQDVAVHVRRGDYVNNRNYVNLLPTYYTNFIKQNPTCNFFIFSDDYEFCKSHFYTYENVEFVEGCSDIEHLYLMSQFKNHMIANSSFSWWGAKLAELYHKEVCVIRPDGLTSGELSKRYMGEYFYPERWKKRAIIDIEINKTRRKINISDTTFIIPVKMDSNERVENLNLVIRYLLHHFKTNIIVGEQGSGKFFSYVEKYGIKYVCFDDMPGFMDRFSGAFWRTRMLNYMTAISPTEIIFNWDCDVLVHHEKIYEAVKLLRKNNFVYPYNGVFARVGREYYSVLNDTLNTECLKGIFFKGMEPDVRRASYGGAVGFRRKAYMEIGMEDENFVSHAPEDFERKNRIKKLGGGLLRTDNPLFHLEHPMRQDSKHNNEWVAVNNLEFRKTYNQSPEKLESYMRTWAWVEEYKKLMK